MDAISFDQTARYLLKRHFSAVAVRQVIPLNNAGGFSGARLWKVETSQGTHCLRRWPSGTNAARVAAIHRVLAHVARRQFELCPRVQLSDQGQSLVVENGATWELASWLPGDAIDPKSCSDQQLASGTQALARFHLAAASYPGCDEFAPATIRTPTGLIQRCQRIESLLSSSLLDSVLNEPIDCAWEPLKSLRRAIVDDFRAIAPRLLGPLRNACQMRVPHQVCLRDIWSAHILFVGDAVTGILDFDAMRVDSIATDLARLLGSLAGDDVKKWQAGLQAYEGVRPISPDERELVQRYDQSAVLLTGIQWLEWIVLQRREFGDVNTVLARLHVTQSRLQYLKSANWVRD